MKKTRTFLLCILLFLIIFLLIGFDSRLETTEYVYQNSKIPASFDNYKICQISDLHCKYFGNNNQTLLDAIQDMNEAKEIVPDLPYVYYNLGNLYCLSSEHIASLDNYTKAITLWPYMGDAYFNRGLVLIYLKDKEKGCIDLSRAGELGVEDAYGVIKKYCEEKNNE